MRHLRAGHRPRRLSRLHHIQFTASGAIHVGKWVMYFGMGGFFARDRDIVALSNIFRALVSCRSLRPLRDCRRAGAFFVARLEFPTLPKADFCEETAIAFFAYTFFALPSAPDSLCRLLFFGVAPRHSPPPPHLGSPMWAGEVDACVACWRGEEGRVGCWVEGGGVSGVGGQLVVWVGGRLSRASRAL